MSYYIRSGSDPRVVGPLSEQDIHGMYRRGTPHLWVSSDEWPAFRQLHEVFRWAAPAKKQWATASIVVVILVVVQLLFCFIWAINEFFLN